MLHKKRYKTKTLNQFPIYIWLLFVSLVWLMVNYVEIVINRVSDVFSDPKIQNNCIEWTHNNESEILYDWHIGTLYGFTIRLSTINPVMIFQC